MEPSVRCFHPLYPSQSEYCIYELLAKSSTPLLRNMIMSQVYELS